MEDTSTQNKNSIELELSFSKIFVVCALRSFSVEVEVAGIEPASREFPLMNLRVYLYLCFRLGSKNKEKLFPAMI